jgi:hypothetical protein
MTASGAAASIAPGPDRPGPVATADDATMTWAEFKAWERQLDSSSECSHPIRLTGQITAVDLATGQTAEVFKTWTDHAYLARDGKPATYREDHPIHVPCGNRRESACPSCSAVYKRDARQLVRAGLSGGKGVPESVAEHPCVFATFTAPSFGPVHARRERGGKVLPCRPRRDANKRVCPHGRDISCPVRHAPDDPRLGRPMCADCYDYEAAVTFNAGVPKLWQRFLTYLPRHLARVAGVRVKDCRELVRPRFVKVTEYQARGVVHYHAVIRLDANTTDGSYRPPGPLWSAELLKKAVPLAAAQASVRFPVGTTGRMLRLRFGAQTDVRIVRFGTAQAVSREAVANYIAKYATKVSEVPGLPDSRIRHASEIDALRCPAHHKRMIETALRLGFGKWAHMLGNGGHFLSKSKRYSVTLGQLRRARAEHRKLERYPDGELDPWGRPLDESVVLVIANWSYAGNGYTPRTPCAELALVSADMARGR